MGELGPSRATCCVMRVASSKVVSQPTLLHATRITHHATRGPHAASLLRMRHVRVVLPQNVLAEVSAEIAPDGVDVVVVVLRIVVFEQERRSLHSIIVAFAFLQAAGPGEVNLLRA